MQVFQRKESILGGIDEAIAVLKQCSGRRPRRTAAGSPAGTALEVRALREGDAIAPWETRDDDRGPVRAASRTSRPSTSAASRGAR